MSRIISKNDPYKASNVSRLQDIVLNPKPMKVIPVYIPTQKGIERI